MWTFPWRIVSMGKAVTNCQVASSNLKTSTDTDKVLEIKFFDFQTEFHLRFSKFYLFTFVPIPVLSNRAHQAQDPFMLWLSPLQNLLIFINIRKYLKYSKILLLKIHNGCDNMIVILIFLDKVFVYLLFKKNHTWGFATVFIWF